MLTGSKLRSTTMPSDKFDWGDDLGGEINWAYIDQQAAKRRRTMPASASCAVGPDSNAIALTLVMAGWCHGYEGDAKVVFVLQKPGVTSAGAVSIAATQGERPKHCRQPCRRLPPSKRCGGVPARPALHASGASSFSVACPT